MARQVMVVLTNSVPGQDDEFNRWYDERHVPDVMAGGPYASVRRFRLAEGSEAPYRYLAFWEIEEDGLEEARAFLASLRADQEAARAEGREPHVPLSPTLADPREVWFFEQIAEAVAETG